MNCISSGHAAVCLCLQSYNGIMLEGSRRRKAHDDVAHLADSRVRFPQAYKNKGEKYQVWFLVLS